jgi:hypothetical protein
MLRLIADAVRQCQVCSPQQCAKRIVHGQVSRTIARFDPAFLIAPSNGVRFASAKDGTILTF